MHAIKLNMHPHPGPPENSFPGALGELSWAKLETPWHAGQQAQQARAHTPHETHTHKLHTYVGGQVQGGQRHTVDFSAAMTWAHTTCTTHTKKVGSQSINSKLCRKSCTWTCTSCSRTRAHFGFMFFRTANMHQWRPSGESSTTQSKHACAVVCTCMCRCMSIASVSERVPTEL